ncbi:hypothetical protein ACFO5K_18530 [Nocardia halotolerans]|uniref:Transposase n=1 Tax=Nocardia halotolerans TaxID=1755878 RepID=A0ABV8VJY0_9NOCA
MNSLLETHRGWVADIFADGLQGRSGEVIGWRALCSCGSWRGRTWLRTDRSADHAPSARVLYCPTGRLDVEPTRLILGEWDYHQLEMQALIPVRLAFQDSASAEQRLVEAVRFVLAAGASWDAVARVIGASSGEAAEQRFSAVMSPEHGVAAGGTDCLRRVVGE